MDQFAREIGYAAIGLALLWAALSLGSRIPGAGRAVRIAALAAWGGLTIGVTLYLVFWKHVPDGNYGVALATFFAGAVLYVPWFFFGLPGLLHELGLRRRARWRGSR